MGDANAVPIIPYANMFALKPGVLSCVSSEALALCFKEEMYEPVATPAANAPANR